jgi:hypothetical protein
MARILSTATLVGTVAATALTGCVNNERPVLEASARQTTPVSVCTEGIAPPKRTRGDSGSVVRDLDPEQWLEIMMPSFDPDEGLKPTATDCTGNYAFANETLRYGISRVGWPRLVDPDELDIRSGPRGVKAVRLRVLSFENGDQGGPIALVRAVDDRAEVFGIGSYRGPVDAKLTPVRMGDEFLLVAEARRCPDTYNCRKTADFYLARRGRLINAATVDIERVQRVPSVSERGLYAEYRMNTDVSYERDGIRLLEQVKVRIIPYEGEAARDSNRTLRKVEFARMLRVDRDTLFSTNESLWERVVGQD